METQNIISNIRSGMNKLIRTFAACTIKPNHERILEIH